MIINLLNTVLIALIAIIMGLLGAYFTNWEQNLYFEYLMYIIPPIGISALLFMFIDQQTALVLGAIFLMGLSWYYSTKLWFKRK